MSYRITNRNHSVSAFGQCFKPEKMNSTLMLLLKAIRRDVLRSAPSICIFLNNFSLVYKNQKNIENRHYVVNMKAIGAVVMTESAITFWIPGAR